MWRFVAGLFGGQSRSAILMQDRGHEGAGLHIAGRDHAVAPVEFSLVDSDVGFMEQVFGRIRVQLDKEHLRYLAQEDPAGTSFRSKYRCNPEYIKMEIRPM